MAEEKRGDVTPVAVAAKHGVSDAALKYHLYKPTGATAVKGKALALLPVRLTGAVAKQVELEFGAGFGFVSSKGAIPRTWLRWIAGCGNPCSRCRRAFGSILLSSQSIFVAAMTA